MRRQRLWLLLLPCCCLAACGLFTPRDDFEQPGKGRGVDHFQFGALLAGLGEGFSSLDWYELFADSMTYNNVDVATIYSRADLVSHLFQQHELYPAVIVDWKRGGYQRTIDTIDLSNTIYTITGRTRPDEVLFSGSSTFRIVRDQTNVWRIWRWVDDPSTRPFFSPEQ